MMNEYFSMELKNLLIKLLCKDPKERVQDISEIKKHIFFKDIDWNKLGKMQIVPPLNLVKNKIENKNIICFKSRKKKEQKDYFLDFHITKNVEHFTFIRKYVHNKNECENNSNINNNIVKEKNGDKTESVIINIDENYIESSEQSKNEHK